MGFRNPVTTAIDPVARSDAQQAETDAQSAAAAAAAAASQANTAGTAANAAAQAAANAQITANQAAASASTANQAAAAAQAATQNITATQISDGAITTPKLAAGAVVAGSIAAGAIDGQTITGATLRTAASGQRIQLDSTHGLVGYNSAGQANTQIDPASGVLTAVGANLTGTLSTSASSAKVQVFQRMDSKGSYGTIEFDDGIAGDVPATLTQIVNENTSPGQALGSVTLDSGSYGIEAAETAGPKLALNVEVPTVAGPNVAVTRLTSPGGFTVNGVPQLGSLWTVDYTNGTYNAALLSGGWGSLPGCTVTLTIPAGQVADIEFRAPYLSLVAGAEVAVRLIVGSTVIDGADYQAASAMRCPLRLAETITGTGAAITVAVQALLAAGASSSCSIQASAGAPVVLRHRIR